MLTRRLSRFPGWSHAFGLFGLTAVLSLSSACVTIEDGDGDGGGDGETGDGDGDGNTDNTDNSDNSDNSDNAENDDSSAAICEDACVNLEACGIPLADCQAICVGGACGECLASSEACGADCAGACSGGDGDGDGDPTGDGDGDGDLPEKECVIDDDCGLGYECVSCGLTDSEGWCEQTMECQYDEDCGFGGKCGYNVETGDWRCLPAEYCG